MIAIRRVIIFMAQILALIFIAVSTVAGALLGDSLLSGIPTLGSATVLLTSVRGISFFGAVAGFFVSTILAAMFYVFVEIAYNTRNPFNT